MEQVLERQQRASKQVDTEEWHRFLCNFGREGHNDAILVVMQLKASDNAKKLYDAERNLG